MKGRYGVAGSSADAGRRTRRVPRRRQRGYHGECATTRTAAGRGAVGESAVARDRRRRGLKGADRQRGACGRGRAPALPRRIAAGSGGLCASPEPTADAAPRSRSGSRGALLVGARGDAAIAALPPRDDTRRRPVPRSERRPRRLLGAFAFGRLTRRARPRTRVTSGSSTPSRRRSGWRSRLTGRCDRRRSPAHGRSPGTRRSFSLTAVYGWRAVTSISIWDGNRGGCRRSPWDRPRGFRMRSPPRRPRRPTSATCDTAALEGDHALRFSGGEPGPFRQVTIARRGQGAWWRGEKPLLDPRPASGETRPRRAGGAAKPW